MKLLILLLCIPFLTQAQDNKTKFWKFQTDYWKYRAQKDTTNMYRMTDSLDKYRKFDARDTTLFFKRNKK